MWKRERERRWENARGARAALLRGARVYAAKTTSIETALFHPPPLYMYCTYPPCANAFELKKKREKKKPVAALFSTFCLSTEFSRSDASHTRCMIFHDLRDRENYGTQHYIAIEYIRERTKDEILAEQSNTISTRQCSSIIARRVTYARDAEKN